MRDSVVGRHLVLSDRSPSSTSTSIDRFLICRVRDTLAGASMRYVLWDGYACEGPGPLVASIVFRNRAALYGLALNPQHHFAEAYVSGALDVEGDLLAALEAGYRAVRGSGTRFHWHLPIGFRAARRHVHHHYDLGTEFYRAWLDPELQYSCAYYPQPTSSLEEAQKAKMELVCRKLRLRPGERVIEAGCGWGSLALYMARTYGVNVRAYNVSRDQIAYARARAGREGLSGRVTFLDEDYRQATGPCDVFVSIGMLEHVGAANYGTFGRLLARLLTADGRGLLHFIGRNTPEQLDPWIVRRIFPGAYAPSLAEVCAAVLQPAGFSVLDVENLRLHYAATLAAWRDRFELAAPDVRHIFDERFVRAWRLYLAGSQASFTTGSLQLFQIVFARGDSNAIPWIRPAPPGVDDGSV